MGSERVESSSDVEIKDVTPCLIWVEQEEAWWFRYPLTDPYLLPKPLETHDPQDPQLVPGRGLCQSICNCAQVQQGDFASC